MSSTEMIVIDDTEINIDLACDQIGQAWHQSIDALFRVVMLIRQCLDKKGFKELQSELDKRHIMKSSVFSMFKTIAQNPTINASNKDSLPPAYNALYYIARIEDQAILKENIENGQINRDITIEEAKKLYSSISGSSKDEYESFKPKPDFVSLASIKIDPKIFTKNKLKIMDLMEQLVDLGLIIKLNEDLV